MGPGEVVMEKLLRVALIAYSAVVANDAAVVGHRL